MTIATTRPTRLAGGAPTPFRLWLGRDVPPTVPTAVDAGSLSFSIDGIDVRALRLGPHELISRVYVAVRDLDWNTVPGTVSGLEMRRSPRATTAMFDVAHEGAGIAYRWRGRIVAYDAGRVTYEMDGRAEAAFAYNKIGFCVLHPAWLAGALYRAVTPHGPVSGRLPALIAPQLIVDGLEVPMIEAFTSIEVELPWVTIATAFEGDLFETEDQRNWTDGSFKTYGTPLALGYPHQAVPGQRFHQVVRISAAAVEPAPAVGTSRAEGGRRSIGATVAPATVERRRPRPVALELVPDPGGRWPAIGLGTASGSSARSLRPRERRLLRALALDHLRLDVRLSDEGWRSRLTQALDDVDALGCRLEAALFASGETGGDLGDAAARLADRRIARVIALHEPTAGTATTPEPWLRLIVEAFPGGPARPPILTGTDGDFAELNRDRPAAGLADGLAYAANPQVHASDERSIVESVPTFGLTVETARTFAGSGPAWIAVSPITLRGRFNPAARPVGGPSPRESTEPPADPRQPSLFAAGWTLGVLASLVAAGADSATFYETTGPRGILGSVPVGPPPSPGIGQVYPVWFVLADLADRVGCAPVRVVPGAGPRICGLALHGPEQLRVLLANVTAVPTRVTLGPIPAPGARVRVLDADTSGRAIAAPQRYRRNGGERRDVGRGRLDLDLGPFAYAFIEARVPRPPPFP